MIPSDVFPQKSVYTHFYFRRRRSRLPRGHESAGDSIKPAFLEHVSELAAFFKKSFEELRTKHPEILVGLRQLGLMMGIEMVSDLCGPFLPKLPTTMAS